MPTTTRCPYCGAILEELTAELFGREVFAGFEECRCDGARAAREEARRREAEEAEKERRRKLLEAIRKAGIMPRFEHAEHPMADECAMEVAKGRNLYIFGGVGTLKTQLASAVAIALIEQGMRGVAFTAMWRVLDEIKAGFRRDYDPLHAYQRASVLVLDDLGKEAPTEFALERMFALVDERSSRMLPTVVTTQYRASRLAERLAMHGDADTAVAIVSRLKQDCMSVEMTGGDRRLS